MVDLLLACRVLDINREKGYELIRDGKFPVPVERIGGTWKVRTADLSTFIRPEAARLATARGATASAGRRRPKRTG